MAQKQFTNKAVAEKYELLTDEQFELSVKGFHGDIANISLPIAEKLIECNSPHIKLKEVKTTTKQ